MDQLNMIKISWNSEIFPGFCFVGATAARLLRTCSCISHFCLKRFAYAIAVPVSSCLLFAMTGNLLFNLFSFEEEWANTLTLFSGYIFQLYVFFSFCELILSPVLFSIKNLFQLIYCLFSFLFFLGRCFDISPFSFCFDEDNEYLFAFIQMLSFLVFISSLTIWTPW